MLAWHYTPGVRFKGIVDAGFIRPAVAGVPENEKPVVWFSLNPYFEETARKIFTDGRGNQRVLLMEETRSLGEGLYRLGVAPKSLLTGEALRMRARIKRETWAQLSARARAIGSDPSSWFGSLTPVNLTDCTVQVMNDDLTWESLAV